MNITVSELAALIRELHAEVDAAPMTITEEHDEPHCQMARIEAVLSHVADSIFAGNEGQFEKDAALGRMVRNMSEGSRLVRDPDSKGSQNWHFLDRAMTPAPGHTPAEVLPPCPEDGAK